MSAATAMEQTVKPTAEPLICAENLSIARGGRVLLKKVSLAVRPGEIVTVVGPNGGGKTTLLRALIGLERPDTGRITARKELRIGYTPQRLAIGHETPMTVESFLRLGGTQTRTVMRKALERVGAAHCAGAAMQDLSGGEMQRALLARALLRRPHLLILDEPTQGVDQLGKAALYQLIGRLRDETGCGVLLVSHDLHVVISASDRVLCLNGHVCCDGAPQQVSADPEYQRLFGSGAGGALALYRHEHDHSHEHGRSHERAAADSQ